MDVVEIKITVCGPHGKMALITTPEKKWGAPDASYFLQSLKLNFKLLDPEKKKSMSSTLILSQGWGTGKWMGC